MEESQRTSKDLKGPQRTCKDPKESSRVLTNHDGWMDRDREGGREGGRECKMLNYVESGHGCSCFPCYSCCLGIFLFFFWVRSDWKWRD